MLYGNSIHYLHVDFFTPRCICASYLYVTQIVVKKIKLKLITYSLRPKKIQPRSWIGHNLVQRI